MKKIILHAASFDTFWAHYNVHQDKHFINELYKLGYQFLLSNETTINDEDYILFSEVSSLGAQSLHISYRGIWRNIKDKIKRLTGLTRVPRPPDIYRQCKANGTLGRTMLIIFEGKLAAPDNHLPKLATLCPYALTWNDELADEKHFIKYHWPQPQEWPEFEFVPYQEKKLLTNISANKYSTHKLELYSARRASILYCEKRLQDQFDLYGIGWNEPATRLQRLGFPVPKFKSYRGEVISKADIFSKYRFALIYENAMVPGWITEKVFDCLRSDCIPIYLGAPNIQEHLPSDIFIDRRNFRNDEELVNYILSIDEYQYNKFRERIVAYLDSDDFRKNLSTALARKIVEVIRKMTVVTT